MKVIGTGAWDRDAREGAARLALSAVFSRSSVRSSMGLTGSRRNHAKRTPKRADDFAAHADETFTVANESAAQANGLSARADESATRVSESFNGVNDSFARTDNSFALAGNSPALLQNSPAPLHDFPANAHNSADLLAGSAAHPVILFTAAATSFLGPGIPAIDAAEVPAFGPIPDPLPSSPLSVCSVFNCLSSPG